MANIARIDRKRLATTDERLATTDGRHPTKKSPPKPRAKRKRTSAAAESPKAAPPKRRRTPALKAMPADPESTAAAPNAASAAPGALKTASPQASPTQESATHRTAAPLSARDSKPSRQAVALMPPALPADAGETDGLRAQFPIPNAEALARNIGQAVEQGGEVLAAYLRPRETGEIKMKLADDGGEMIRSIGQLGQYYMAHPLKAFEAQTALTMNFINLWASTLQRFLAAR
jgi:polyhydroxyalkanoate synthase subunit PhaC